jgi:hypothetical protein
LYPSIEVLEEAPLPMASLIYLRLSSLKPWKLFGLCVKVN